MVLSVFKSNISILTKAATQKLQLLVPSAADSNLSDGIRALAAVLLRRTFTGQWEESWSSIGADMQTELKKSLLELLASVCNDGCSSIVRKRISDCVAELARRLVDEAESNKIHPWEDIINIMLQLAQTNTVAGLETVLNIINQSPGIFGILIEKYIDILQQLLSKS